MTYNGGPIITGAFNVVLVFYNADYPNEWGVYDYVANLGSTSWARVLNQYYDSHGAHINGANIAYGGYSSGPIPTAKCATAVSPCTISGNDIHNFLLQYDAMQGYADLTRHYALFFDQHVTISDPGFTQCQQFCGYHTYMYGNNNNLFTYSVYPTCASGCSSGMAALESVISHEIAETMTDPEMNGWYGTGGTGSEIGDICAWQDATVTAANGNSYTVQKIWSNAANACVAA